MLQQATYTLSAATATQVVAPTIDAGHYVLKNIQPPASGEDYARQGYVYQYGNTFTITQGSTASFSFLTGATGAQIEFYQITTTDTDVKAELIEGATIVTTGSPIPAYNINRNFADSHASVLKAATSVTGGTTFTMEYLTGTNQAGSAQKFDKVITLEPNSEYAFKFTNAGSQTTTVFFEVGWSELFNGYHDIWLGTPNESYVLRGGEEIKFKLFPGEAIDATGGHTGAKLTVVRQD
jgi:hypothetical protein